MKSTTGITTTILHISDLHFTCNSSMHNMRDVVIKEVRERVHDKPLGKKLLVITGDFHNFTAKDFSDSIKYIGDLIAAMNIRPHEDVFLVPGNHDAGNDSLMAEYVADTIPDWKMKKDSAITQIELEKYE